MTLPEKIRKCMEEYDKSRGLDVELNLTEEEREYLSQRIMGMLHEGNESNNLQKSRSNSVK